VKMKVEKAAGIQCRQQSSVASRERREKESGGRAVKEEEMREDKRSRQGSSGIGVGEGGKGGRTLHREEEEVGGR